MPILELPGSWLRASALAACGAAAFVAYPFPALAQSQDAPPAATQPPPGAPPPGQYPYPAPAPAPAPAPQPGYPGYPPAPPYAPAPAPYAPAPAPYAPATPPYAPAPMPPGAAYATPAAVPPPAPSFGKSGQLVVTHGLGFLYHDKFETELTINPSFDVFVGNVVTLGGGLIIDHYKYSDGSQSYTNFGLSFRFGINANLGPRVSIWPLLVNSGVYASSNASYGETLVAVPLLIHIVPHLFFAVGPQVSALRHTDTVRYGTSLQWSEELDTFIGGWW